MKRLATCALLAILGAANAADVKLATRDWVTSQLMASGIRISAATTTRNTNGTFTVTVPFTSPDVTNCVSLSLTFTNPRITQPQAQPVLRGAKLMRGAATVQDEKLVITLTEGSWRDSASPLSKEHVFVFSGGFDFTWPSDLPEVPSEDHVCELDVDCNCVWMNKVPKYPDDYPEEYRLATMEDFDNADFGNVLTWIDTSTWPDQTEAAGKVRYWITDTNGNRFNLEQIGKTDLWRNAVGEAMEKLNERFRECCEAFAKSCECNATNPQHDWNTKTCGSHSWSVCRNNSAHTQGTEGHDFPYVGGNYTATHHSCKCGDRTEAHGTLVTDGTKTATYNSDGKETGWIQDMVCPKGCGYSKTVTHTHHFTNCGTCDAGDGCDTVCTGCSGNHVFGDATDEECAKCECTMCEDCDAHPDDTDITKHSGWMPCSQDIEDDNDDGKANGGHCQCQCLTFGHNAETEHDYKMPSGMDEYEPYNDKKHYHLIGRCTRCAQWKKRFQAHSYPNDPTEYKYVSPSVCRRSYTCEMEGCGHANHDDTHGHEVGSSVEAYVYVSASVCRRLKKCGKCQSYVPDDTHGHERDSANGCKCANGCGYQFDHNYVSDACGNSVCSYCGAYQGSQYSHSGWDSNAGAADGHKCACGKTVISHSYGTPTVVSRVGWLVTYRETCTVCSYYHEWQTDVNPCKSGHVLNTQSTTCECLCGYYSPTNEVSTAEEMHNFADTENADGVKICTCKCGRFHVQRQWTSYRKNTEDAVDSKGACLNVCAYCTDKEGTGLDIGPVDDSRHTPRTKGTCGCKCGKLTADGTNLEQFHIQKPGSCRCYGRDGNGGGWHFKCPKNGCTKICAYSSTSGLYSGEDHHVASSAKEHATPAKATPSDHTKTDGSSCGCKCGTYTSANYSSWTQHANLHNSYPYHCGCYCGHASESQISPYHKKASDTQCRCQCGAKVVSHARVSGDCRCQCRAEHYRQARQDGKCPGVCHGPCGQYMDYSHKDDHTAKEDGCGCECGQFGGNSYTENRWHHGTGSPSCHCSCGYLHRFSPSACPNVCSVCKMDKAAARSDADIHTFPSGQCECNCERYKKHKFASDACACYCGDITRGHVWREKTRTFKEQYECQSCGETINVDHIVWECARCGEEFDGTDEEDGHAPTCGDRPEEGDQYPGGYCEKHNEYYDDACPKCMEEEEGGGGDGGGGNGGFTGGPGGYRDI